MEPVEAARRWAAVWQQEWPARNLEGILALYHAEVAYFSEPFREPFRGIGELRDYLGAAFAEEEGLEGWFGTPLVTGQRASVEWWASLVEAGVETTIVGTSNLRFDEAGLVVEQRDTWNQRDGRRPPFEGWGR